jgi:putative membrane protein
MMIAIGIYAWLIAYAELNWVRIGVRDSLKNLTILHSLLGFVISLLLVFRTNTAYDRWWEGRRQWGALVNSSRNLAIKLKAALGSDTEEMRFFFRMIPMYAKALRFHLLSERLRLDLDALPHPEIAGWETARHQPNKIASLMASRVYGLHASGRIDGHVLQTLMNDVQSLTDICGACERIKNTPIPLSYSIFIKKFIFFYVMTLPMGFVFSLGYYIIPVVIFVFYVLTSIEIIAEEIEDPFGSDNNDLPLERLSIGIQSHVEEILAW